MESAVLLTPPTPFEPHIKDRLSLLIVSDIHNSIINLQKLQKVVASSAVFLFPIIFSNSPIYLVNMMR